MRILHLTLKKKWFDMIAAGDKPEEYREIKPYWVDRLLAPKSPSWSLWEEPGCYDECIQDLNYPIERFRNTEEVLEYHQVKAVQFDIVKLKNGYSKNSPEIELEWYGLKISKPISGLCEEGWLDRFVFTTKLGKILSIKNYKTINNYGK